jgi:voltage-gated potassium channel
MKVEKRIESMKDHYIICGHGRIGSLICREFAAKPLSFVVVESNPSIIEKLEGEHYPYIRGNATEDETLLRAGIKRAKGLIAVVTSDTENVYITLDAAEPGPVILARAGRTVPTSSFSAGPIRSFLPTRSAGPAWPRPF